MPVISQDAALQTVITTFDVSPASCDGLLEVLKEACDGFVRHQPGFIGAAMHVNDARTRIANYTQWKSRDDFQAMVRSDEMQAFNARFGALCKSFEPVLYDVVVSVD
jgi:quinol monooxygenase YgiN